MTYADFFLGFVEIRPRCFVSGNRGSLNFDYLMSPGGTRRVGGLSPLLSNPPNRIIKLSSGISGN